MSKHLANSIAQSTKNQLKNITNTSKFMRTGESISSGMSCDEGESKPGMTLGSCIYVYVLMTEECTILDQHSSCYHGQKLPMTHCAWECFEGKKPLMLAEYEKCKLTPAFVVDAHAKILKSKGNKGGGRNRSGGSITIFDNFLTTAVMLNLIMCSLLI